MRKLRVAGTAMALCVGADPACTDPAARVDVVERTDIGSADDATAADDTPDPCDPRLLDVQTPRPSWDVEPGAALPNLIADLGTIQIQTRTFSTASCEVTEGCTLPGTRRLLRFDIRTVNLGPGDLFLGSPNDPDRPPALFEFSQCHNHWHFRAHADYQLIDAAGNAVGHGHKQSFCIEDNFRFHNMGPYLCPQEAYTCNRQGLHPGWFDIYPRSVDCQYVDVTDVAPGDYRLRVEVNYQHLIAETTFDDNVAWLSVTLAVPGDAGAPQDPTDACDATVVGIERDCGWVAESSRACIRGTSVTVGCSAACAPSVGDCTGDAMIRVCPGDSPCNHAQAIAESDDSCGTQCPMVTFQCPSVEHYNIMTGPHASGSAHACRVATR